MVFAESLPEECPPETAEDIALYDVWRFIKKKAPEESDFDSHAKRELENKHGASECDFASCSLFLVSGQKSPRNGEDSHVQKEIGM